MHVIIIHGSTFSIKKPKWLKKLTNRLVTYLHIGLPSISYAYKFKNYLKNKSIEAEVFEWDGSIWLKDIKEASEKLDSIIKNKNDKVILFSKSNGGLIAQFSALNNENKVSKIIQLATPNISRYYSNNIPIENIYSHYDKMQIAGILLHSISTFRRGSRSLKGKYVNNRLLDLRKHREFNSEKMFGFYYSLIKHNSI